MELTECDNFIAPFDCFTEAVDPCHFCRKDERFTPEDANRVEWPAL